MLGRNLRAGRGEVDLVVRDGSTLVAVEVKTRRGADPYDQFTGVKAQRVREAMTRLDPAPRRLDLVTVVIAGGLATVRWVRNAG